MFGGLGSAVNTTGGLISLYGGYKAGKSRRKAAKAQYGAMQDALNQYRKGSTDALGNTLSANKDGRWSYDLGNAGQSAKTAANNANYLMATTPNKTSQQLMRDNLMGNQLANTLTARANQNAAMRSGARTNSNLGRIANSYGKAGSQGLRDNYLQGIQAGKNAVNYNANMRNALAQTANASNQQIQNIQGNLQNMVNGLNATAMNQGNNLAQATANPYMHGMSNADMWKGIGGFVSSIGQNMEMSENVLLSAILGSMNKNNSTNGANTGSNEEVSNALSSILPLLAKLYMGGA